MRSHIEVRLEVTVQGQLKDKNKNKIKNKLKFYAKANGKRFLTGELIVNLKRFQIASF